MEMNQKRINQAIRDCLRLCYGSSHVIPTIAAFLAARKASGYWHADEIRAVEIGVHQVLQRLMVGPIYPATDQPVVGTGRDGSETAKMTGA